MLWLLLGNGEISKALILPFFTDLLPQIISLNLLYFSSFFIQLQAYRGMIVFTFLKVDGDRLCSVILLFSV